MSDHDLLRTLTEFTAMTVADAIKPYGIGNSPKLLVCVGALTTRLS
ncbi:hypothetical protein JCM19235_4995 [Vibrio maritimus]|uniref:Uncharacterized protein n=1 Tax=Vibrio maritimus TaxID=990268 RepID=A0A090S415_9VIBR|nr:hypothetical protein JCM19235_4995 [Vibrio maritimus]